jgi:hypothetical protein
VTCPHGPSCPECQRQDALAAERERRALAAEIARVNPPAVLESTRLNPGMAVAQFGVEGGIKILQAQAARKAGVTSIEELTARNAAGRAQPGVAYREPPDVPVVVPRRAPPRPTCPVCCMVVAFPGAPCDHGGDPDWAVPPS